MTLRIASLYAAAAMMSACVPTFVCASTFPALNSPPSSERLPGKLVWADLFTTNPDAATTFYTGLLGWTASTLEQKGRAYTVFSNAGIPVAGLSPRSAQGSGHPSRWIGYYSVDDVTATLALVTKAGGVVRAPSRGFPNRGFQAIATDRDGIPIGFLQSSSGDTPDGETAPGAWNWFELYARDPKVASDFYHDVLGYMVVPDEKSEQKTEFVLSSGGMNRGGLAPVPQGADNKPSWLGVIRVADLDKTLAKVVPLGGEILVAPHSVEYGSRFAIILDPTGGTLGLVEYIDSANPANLK